MTRKEIAALVATFKEDVATVVPLVAAALHDNPEACRLQLYAIVANSLPPEMGSRAYRANFSQGRRARRPVPEMVDEGRRLLVDAARELLAMVP
jgi:hypothetical protein